MKKKEHPRTPPEREPLFIGAGIRGAKTVDGVFQPYIEIDGKSCIETVVEAALEARLVGDVYVWGNQETLPLLLARQLKTQRGRLHIVAERSNIIESFCFTFIRYLSDKNLTVKDPDTWKSAREIDWAELKSSVRDISPHLLCVNFITSDTPFLTSAEIDFMIGHKNREADLILGRTLRGDFERILLSTGKDFDYARAVKNYYQVIIDDRSVDSITNSFISVKPLLIKAYAWNVVHNFYKNRTIISGNKYNYAKISNNIKAFFQLVFPQKEKAARRYPSRLRSALYLTRAYRCIVNHRLSKGKYLDYRSIVEHLQTLLDLRIENLFSPAFGLAYDLDTAYEVEFARRNHGLIMSLLGQDIPAGGPCPFPKGAGGPQP